jgi:hypothetical protein
LIARPIGVLAGSAMMKRSAVIWRAACVLASAAIVGAAIVAWRPSGDVGYVQINTVPVTTVSQAPLYFDTVRLAPVRNGTALLRQSVGTLTLRGEVYGNNLVPLCQIEVRKDRITTITVSVLERPPRCVCRLNAGGDTTNRMCVS